MKIMIRTRRRFDGFSQWEIRTLKLSRRKCSLIRTELEGEAFSGFRVAGVMKFRK